MIFFATPKNVTNICLRTATYLNVIFFALAPSPLRGWGCFHLVVCVWSALVACSRWQSPRSAPKRAEDPSHPVCLRCDQQRGRSRDVGPAAVGWREQWGRGSVEESHGWFQICFDFPPLKNMDKNIRIIYIYICMLYITYIIYYMYNI